MAEATINNSASIVTEESKPFRISIKMDRDSDPLVLEGWKAYAALGTTAAATVVGAVTIIKSVVDLFRD